MSNDFLVVDTSNKKRTKLKLQVDELAISTFIFVSISQTKLFIKSTRKLLYTILTNSTIVDFKKKKKKKKKKNNNKKINTINIIVVAKTYIIKKNNRIARNNKERNKHIEIIDNNDINVVSNI